jgi:hypothetical protein
MQNTATPVSLAQVQASKVYEHVPLQEFWTEHRTTLISYEAQFVHALRPDPEEEPPRVKGKKKSIEFEGGFLFPGRPGDREENIEQTVMASKYGCLRELFEERGAGGGPEWASLREFVKIMLELKHSCILREFLELY